MSPHRRADAIRWGALAIGIVLFGAALYYINVTLAVGTIRRLGLALPLALICSGLWHVLRTWAWAWCFPRPRRISFLRLMRVRLAAEAFSYLTLRGIAGEPLKVVLLRDRIDPRDATAAVALERIAYLTGTTLIVGIGSIIAILVLPLTRLWFRVFRGFAIAAGVVTLLSILVISGRGTYVRRLFERWDKRFGTSVARGRIARFITAVERQMLDLVRGNPRRLLVLLTATAASYACMALEAWVILKASGTPVSPIGALTIETFSRVASFASSFIPANLGALEASSLAAVAAVGVSGGGAALALARRIRGLFWAGVGLAIYPRGAQRLRADSGEHPGMSGAGPVLLYVMRDPQVHVPPHVRLSALPLSERILRAAFRAGYSRVIVWTGEPDMRRDGQRAFDQTVREMPGPVTLAGTADEWRVSVASLADRVVTAVGPGTLVSPALLEDAAAATTDGEVVDIAAGEKWPVSGVVRMDAASAADLGSLASVLRERIGAGDRPTGDDVAHGRARLTLRMVNPDDVPDAEAALRRSSYKDTDAKVARFNRRMSLPVSMVLMRTPITANQVSVVLVAMGFYAGWLFSIGHYWTGVLAGFLSLAASVLDGCDGEIARLKYQESALGCWIETFGDYSYYIAIFVGLTVGAVVQTGFQAFYWVGVIALAGTVVTFVLLIYLRARITGGQPNRLHAVAKARFKAEPTVWSRLIWRISFVATRAAMPYGIFALSLLYLLPVVVVLAAIGSNVYWLSLVLKLRDLLRQEETVAA